jgi:hypothetical protein
MTDPQLESTGSTDRATVSADAAAAAAARAGILANDHAERYAQLTDDQVRLKLRMAGKVWKAKWPDEVRGYLAQVKSRRQMLYDRRSGKLAGDSEGDMRQGFVEPPQSFTGLLSMSEFQTKMLYGVPCGIGDKLWHLRDRYKRILREEFDIGWITDVRMSQRGLD